MGKLVGVRYNDIIINNNLREDNPERTGLFVWERFGIIKVTDGNDNFWEFVNDKGAALEINGRLDIARYLEDYNEKLKAVANA